MLRGHYSQDPNSAWRTSSVVRLRVVRFLQEPDPAEVTTAPPTDWSMDVVTGTCPMSLPTASFGIAQPDATTVTHPLVFKHTTAASSALERLRMRNLVPQRAPALSVNADGSYAATGGADQHWPQMSLFDRVQADAGHVTANPAKLLQGPPEPPAFLESVTALYPCAAANPVCILHNQGHVWESR